MTTRSMRIEQTGPSTDILSELRTAVAIGSINEVLQRSVQIIKRGSERYDWIGVYLVKGTTLSLAAYAGKGETEHVQIPIGQGICGLAAKEAQTIIVPDVNKDPRYLMCFPSTRSEIVVPIKGNTTVLGEIDIDSDTLAAFSTDDQKFLEAAANVLADYLDKQKII